MSGRAIPWHKIAVIAIVGCAILGAISYVVNQRLIGAVFIVLGGLLISFTFAATPSEKSWWKRLETPLLVLFLVGYFGSVSLGRHHYTGRITAVHFVDAGRSRYYNVTVKNAHATYHLEDSVNLLVGKFHRLHPHVTDQAVTVTTAGLFNNGVLRQNIIDIN